VEKPQYEHWDENPTVEVTSSACSNVARLGRWTMKNADEDRTNAFE